MANPKIRFNLDLNINFQSESGLQSLQDLFDKKMEEIEKNAEEAVQELGEMTRELMVANIEANGSVKTGAFVNSIVVQFEDSMTFLVGSNLSSIVPTIIEEGRGEVHATNANFLHYESDGKEYFVKSVGGYEGAPYIAPTAEAISNVAKDVILNKISSSG